MNRETAQLFCSILTLFVLGGTVVLLACRGLRRRYAWPALVTSTVAPYGLPLAALIAVGSAAGSLYFSEVANYAPCSLCWYQRTAMFPLAVILAIAAARRDRSIRVYAVPLAAAGAAIALYHTLLQRYPSLDAGVCSVEVPCDVVWFERFGFVTFPFMALVAFVAMITLVTLPEEMS